MDIVVCMLAGPVYRVIGNVISAAAACDCARENESYER